MCGYCGWGCADIGCYCDCSAENQRGEEEVEFIGETVIGGVVAEPAGKGIIKSVRRRLPDPLMTSSAI